MFVYVCISVCVCERCVHVCVHVCIKTYIHTYTQAGTAPSIVLYVEEYNISLFLKKNCCGAVTCVTLHISTSHAVVNARGCWPTTTSSGPVILPTFARSTPAAPTRPVHAQPAACDGCGESPKAASCLRRTIASPYCSHRCPVCPETSAVRAGSVVRAQGPGCRLDGRDPSQSRERSRTIQEKRQEGRLQLSRQQSQRDHRSSSRCVSHGACTRARAKDRACACTLTYAPGALIVSAAGVCDSMHLSLFPRCPLLPLPSFSPSRAQ